jgi:phage baseplate assembly protein W
MAKTQTIAPRLPLASNDRFGYDMLVNIRQAVKQNFKCLLLTAPGERIMDPSFGVGMKKYIFQNHGPEVEKNIKVNIRQQAQKYMPFISIVDATIIFGDPVDVQTDSASSNKLSLSINYVIQSVGISDILNLTLDE